MKREALKWIGGALLVAVLIALATALLMPEMAELSGRYSVL